MKCLTIGSIAVVFFSLSTVSSSILQGIDLMRLSVTNSAISLGIHVVLVYVMLNVFSMGLTGLVLGNVTFALVVCILNWRSIGKALGYKQEVMTTFLIPGASAMIMGLACHFLYKALFYLTSHVLISFIITFVMAVLIYATAILFFDGVTEEEIKEMPLGGKMHRLLVKIHVFEVNEDITED